MNRLMQRLLADFEQLGEQYDVILNRCEAEQRDPTARAEAAEFTRATGARWGPWPTGWSSCGPTTTAACSPSTPPRPCPGEPVPPGYITPGSGGAPAPRWPPGPGLRPW